MKTFLKAFYYCSLISRKDAFVMIRVKFDEYFKKCFKATRLLFYNVSLLHLLFAKKLILKIFGEMFQKSRKDKMFYLKWDDLLI